MRAFRPLTTKTARFGGRSFVCKKGMSRESRRGAFDMMLAVLPQARNSVPHELSRPVSPEPQSGTISGHHFP
jgi:hypothetical protein